MTHLNIKNNTVRQLISYGFIGVCCSLVDVAVFSLLVYCLSINEYVANIASVFIGLTISFISNRAFTFKITNHPALRYASFFIIGMLGLLLSELILFIFTNAGASALFAKFISVIFVGVFQFICNKFISFRTRSESESI